VREMRNGFYLIIILISLLIISGCGKLDAIKFWQEDGKKDVEKAQTESNDQSLDGGEKKFDVVSAGQFKGERKQTLYGANNYAELAGFIQQSTLDNFFSGVLQGTVTKTVDNPYLIGETNEEGSPKAKLADLKKKIIDANIVKWQIAKISPVNDKSKLIAIHYYLADGREFISEMFLVKLQAEEWYIDFEAFYDSFVEVSQFAAAGAGLNSLES